MTTLTFRLMAAATVSAALWTLPASAGDLSGGNPGNPDAARTLESGTTFQFRKAKPVPALRSEGSSRALELDEDAAIRSYTAVGKTAGGADIRIEPSENVKKAVRGQLAPAERGNIKGGSLDPLSRVTLASFGGMGA